MNNQAKNKMITLLIGSLGGFLAIVFIIIIGLVPINSNFLNFDQDLKESEVKTENKNEIGQLYDNTVDSVITIVNLQKIKVNNELLQQYIDATTNNIPVEAGVGSGYVYKKENGYYYAVTNNHVVDGSDELGIITTQTMDKVKKTLDAQLVGIDEQNDIAIIKFKSDTEIKPLTFGDSTSIYPGQEVYAIGSPFGKEFQGSITKGIISAPLRITEDSNGIEQEYIQTDAAINPGNSGGPLLNVKGEILGMNTLKISDSSADNMGFAIPSEKILEIISEIEKLEKK